ncbi:hypothetical protein [Streptomyces hydrogenans]|uniref:hypothetical protein n=1 Tax=Streptomyces hydrogenans TaxID=1873719 RepID=UPI0035E0E19E
MKQLGSYSVLARGWTPAGERRGRMDRLLPAPAGMVPSTSSQTKTGIDCSPRPRG